MATLQALRSRKIAGAAGSVIEGADLTRPQPDEDLDAVRMKAFVAN